MGSAATMGRTPLPDDYRGSGAEQMMELLAGGKMVLAGDKEKAMKAVYEVVVGEGVGVGRAAERLLPLGSDITVRIKVVQDYLAHALEVFGDVTNNVNLDE